MFNNKRLVLPGIGIAVVAALAVAVGVVAVSAGDGSDDQGLREGASADGGSGALGTCLEGASDCDDMIVTPDGDAPYEPSDPDEPASSDPVTSIDDIDPAQCNLVHNIDACQLQATAAAVNDLTGRLGIPPEQVDLLSAEFTQWPDSCLGIARPDTACAEVITSGFRLTFEYDGAQYEYHTDATGAQALLVE